MRRYLYVTLVTLLLVSAVTVSTWRTSRAQESVVYVFEAKGCKQIGLAGRCDAVSFAGKFTVNPGIVPSYQFGHPEQTTSGFVSCTDCLVTPTQPSKAFGGKWRTLPTGDFFFTVQMSTGEAQFVAYLTQGSEVYGVIRQIFPLNYQTSGTLIKQ